MGRCLDHRRGPAYIALTYKTTCACLCTNLRGIFTYTPREPCLAPEKPTRPPHVVQMYFARTPPQTMRLPPIITTAVASHPFSLCLQVYIVQSTSTSTQITRASSLDKRIGISAGVRSEVEIAQSFIITSPRVHGWKRMEASK